MIGFPPMVIRTRSSHVWTQVIRAEVESPPESSRSSTGKRSPDFGAATAVKWSASMVASSVVVSGRAKWYAPNHNPAALAAARFVAYIGSEYVCPSVALWNANRYPAPATFVQSMAFCQCETSMPSIALGGESRNGSTKDGLDWARAVPLHRAR